MVKKKDFKTTALDKINPAIPSFSGRTPTRHFFMKARESTPTLLINVSKKYQPKSLKISSHKENASSESSYTFTI